MSVAGKETAVVWVENLYKCSSGIRPRLFGCSNRIHLNASKLLRVMLLYTARKRDDYEN